MVTGVFSWGPRSKVNRFYDISTRDSGSESTRSRSPRRTNPPEPAWDQQEVDDEASCGRCGGGHGDAAGRAGAGDLGAGDGEGRTHPAAVRPRGRLRQLCPDG